MPTVNDALEKAASYLGYVEGPKNNETPFGHWAGTNFQPWCMAFVSYVLDSVGLGIGRVAYCPTGLAYFRSAGRLSATPQPGDVMFLWFPSKGRYAHTGFVKQVDGDWIVTVEGNSNAAGSRTGGSVVSLRRRWAGTKTVFGRPLYAAAPAAPAPPPPAAAPATGLVLRRGAKGGEVRRLQDTLRARGFDPGRTDGDFGTRTDAAVRAFQRARGLAVDGVVGPRTWGALG